ncbi:MAG: hypothetical protein ACK6CT_04200 [Planctomycetia bacterium]
MATNFFVARRQRGILIAALLLSSASTGDGLCLADELPAAIPPQRSAPLPLTVEADPATPVHRIVIPKAVLAKLAGDFPGAGAIASASPARSIVAALALSAAVACGLVASRQGRPGRLAATVLVGLIAAATTGAVVYADKGPPPSLARRPDRVEPPGGERSAGERPESVVLAQGGKVILEIAAGGEEAVVIVVGKKPEAKEPNVRPPRMLAPADR